MGTEASCARNGRRRVAGGVGPYRLFPPAEGADRPGAFEPPDVDEPLLLGLFALGTGPRAAAALLRGEAFGVEATLCAAVFVTSAVLLVRALFRRRLGVADEGDCR